MVSTGSYDEVIIDFLTKAQHAWGYAIGMDKETIPELPGVKTFQPFTLETDYGKLSHRDVYWGKKASGGVQIVSVNDQPTLLIHFRGGEPKWVSGELVQEINDFLKLALRMVPQARIPAGYTTTYSFQNDKYLYYGSGKGNLWDFSWVEVIAKVEDKDKIVKFFGPEMRHFVESRGLGSISESDPVLFLHTFSHQIIS